MTDYIHELMKFSPISLSGITFSILIIAGIFYFIKPAPVGKDENPKWFYQSARFILSLSALLIPTLYDKFVPEVSGDFRWYWMHISALTLCLLFLAAKFFNQDSKVTLKLPLASWGIIGIAFTATISLAVAYNEARAWWFLKHMLAYCTLFGFVYYLRHPQWYRNLLWFLALTLGFNALLGILQFHGITDAVIAQHIPYWNMISDYTISIDRFRQAAPPAGTLSNKNIAASYLVIVLPMVFYLILESKKLPAKIFASTIFALGMTFLIYTRSRGSWLGFVAAVVFFTLWVVINKNQRKIFSKHLTRINLSILITIIPVVLYLSALQSPLKTHSMDRTFGEQAESIAKLSADELGTRMAYNVNGAKIFLDHWLTGVGINNFHTIYPRYHEAWMPTPEIGYSLKARPQRSHNDIMQIFIETGIFGGLSYFLVFASLLYMTWHIARSKNEDASIISVFLMTGIVGLTVNSLGDFPLQMPTAPALMWIFAGMITGLFVMNHKGKTHFGLNKEFPLPYTIYAGLALVVSCALTWIAIDDYKHRTGNMYLKSAIGYVHAGRFDHNAFQLVTESYNHYKMNTRMQEYRGIIYSNVKQLGGKEVPRHIMIKAMEEALTYDKFSPNVMINLAQNYTMIADKYRTQNMPQKASEWIEKAEKLQETLIYTAGFAYHTYLLGGIIHSLKGEYVKALALYRKADELAGGRVKGIKLGIENTVNILKRQGKFDPVYLGEPAVIRLPAPATVKE